MYVKARDSKSVRCSEFRGGRFSEVANVLHKRDFQSVTATLSAAGSVSASRSVRSGRFYCIVLASFHTETKYSIEKCKTCVMFMLDIHHHICSHFIHSLRRYVSTLFSLLVRGHLQCLSVT